MKEQEHIKKIADYLENLSFKKKIVFGLDETDVWKKIQELDSLYQEAMKIQAIRYEALIEALDKDL